ncbi:MAG: hypothetical protein AB7N53_04445 [Candidatus Binatia bacterium]
MQHMGEHAAAIETRYGNAAAQLEQQGGERLRRARA